MCISFSIAFTKQDAGTAVWCSILSFFTFIYFQAPFIELGACKDGCCTNCCTDGCSCANGKNCCCCSLLCCTKKTEELKILHISNAGRNLVPSIVTRMFGVNTLNTSIFGPIFIGGVMIPFLLKRYSEIKLPTYLAYFSGKRLLPLICSLSVLPLALLTLLFWPWIWTALSYLGNWIAKSEGVDTFFFGLLEKLLIPTGFHHIFASLFWYSPLGGDVQLALKDDNGGKCCELLCCKNNISLNSPSLQGDALIGLYSLSFPTNDITSKKIFEHFQEKKIFAGRLAQGKFPIMQFALPAAALGIYYSHHPQKRAEAKKTLVPGVWNSLILGITEPIEFSFMYTIPKLFYWFHSTMCGLSFLLMRLSGSHIPTSFSGGIIELIINGVIPVQKGTQFYYWAAIGSGLAIIYFTVFYYSFLKFHTQQPTATEPNLAGGEQKPALSEMELWKSGLGGWNNVTNYKNCASRLRYDIKDKNRVIESDLKKAGVIAIKWVGDNHVQLIVGPKAEEINTKLSKAAMASNS
nr:PTS transporter subunit EIIC [Candidatus Mycoplasma haematominutum]